MAEMMDRDNRQERSFSSDDTEFLDLPLPLPPKHAKAVQIENLDIHQPIEAILFDAVDNIEDIDGESTPSCGTHGSDVEDGSNTPQNECRWSISDEESSYYRERMSLHKYDSTCCDEDFTWVRSEPTIDTLSPPPASMTSTQTGSGKPPRPSGSLDRRRQSHTKRHERDHKSKSTHSLKEKSLSSDVRENYVNSHKESRRDNGYQSETYLNQHPHRRRSPGFWEPPPPPTIPYPGYDMHHFWGCHASREELRQYDYHRRYDYYRYGSSGALPLSASQDLYGSMQSCCNRYQPTCCSCEHRSISCTMNQRQDTDERLRRLQSEKESLAMQVQALTEQVSAQSDKIIELERYLTDKTQLLNNTEDMLQRVSAFAKSVGLQLDQQKEMLSRSSLETQKLELMSAMSELKLQQAALERENLELRASQVNNNSLPTRRPPAAPGRMLSSTPHASMNSVAMHGSINSLQQSTNVSPIAPKTPPASFRHQVNPHFSSLPRTSFASSLSNGSAQKPLSTTQMGSSGSQVNTTQVDSNANPKQRNVAFGKNLVEMHLMNSLPSVPTAVRPINSQSEQHILDQCPTQPQQPQPLMLRGFEKQRGFSVPNLADTEKVIDDTVELPRSYTPQPTTSPSLGQKAKGLRSIFGKIKRSNSGNLEDLTGEGEFKRGGIRATAGARLGWSQIPKPTAPFKEWNIDEVCSWFEEIGLDCYEEELRKWLKKGAIELIEASPVDIEKELYLKTPIHRKKIVLAVAELSGNETDSLMLNAGKLDTSWIMRWLDDIGLPQHKDSFMAARLDGRILHKLTMDDLATLHVTSCLHVSSLRRGIQIMRQNNWNPDCLIRRSSDDTNTNEPIALWTAHRVMEWLRLVDLAEYAPNLRGAGVHGALMIFEPKFTAELLADLLSIPPSKTLLRRHLATHFKELLGRDIIQGKRDAENTLGYQPLTITAKVKTPKKSQFSLKRKKSTKGGDEWSDFVCPMGPSGDHLLTSSSFNQNATASGVSMMNPTIQQVAAGIEAVSLPNSAGSPTSSRSSNSVS